MSLDQNSGEEIQMEQDLLEILELVTRQTGDEIIGSLETINSLDVKSIIKLLGTVMGRLHCVIQPALEDLIRRVAKEVVDTAFAKILTGNPANEFHFSEQRRLQLKFKYKLLLPLWTGIPIKSENDTSIEVTLVDSLTGEVIDSGPEASAKVEIVVVKGENNYEGGLDFEGFNQNIVREREENKPLLGGDVFVDLREGTGCVSKVYFAHSSNWMKNCRFRLGARIVDIFQGTKIREAVTESFVIRDRRMKLHEKHEIPSLSDKVWRLKNISKRGVFCKRLKESNIETVKEFLTEHFINPQKLQAVCGATVSSKTFNETIAHALKCELDDMYMYYSSCTAQKTGAIFNVVGQLIGAIYETHYVPIDKLSKEQKMEAHELVVSAFKHWGEVIPIDKNSPFFDGSEIPNAFYVHNSHGLENFGVDNDGDLIMIDDHENEFSTNYYQGITSPDASDWSVNITDDLGTYTDSIYDLWSYF